MTKLKEIKRAIDANLEKQSLTATETNWLVDTTELARAALEATKNPSAEMFGGAGAEVLNRYVGKDPADYPYGTAQWADECFNAMIQAALDEK